MTILSQYKSSLKRREAEELLDVWLYRPIAFVLARVLVHTSATPNQITGASIFSAALAGLALSAGDRRGFVLGASLYAVSNVLDCCDGMVARMKGNGTALGRMVDVFADCFSGAMVYIGLGIGLTSAGTDLPLPAWVLVVVGGISFAVQAALFDRQRNAYLSLVGGGAASIASEVAAVAPSTIGSSRMPGAVARRALARLYERYMSWQATKSAEAHAEPAYERRLLRMWSLVGSTMHVTVFCGALLLDAPLALFAWTAVIGNVWTAAMLVLRRRSRSSSHDVVVAKDADPVVAVILAAGTGTRLRPYTDDVPKPLVDVAGRPLLAWSLDALVAAGIERFVVVVGYRSSRVDAYIATNYPSLDVELVYNHDFDNSNNAASLVLAADSLNGGERLLLLDGDLLYDPTIVADLVRIGTSALVVRSSGGLGEEEMKVRLDRQGRVRRIGKHLSIGESHGESIGIALFDEAATHRLFRTLRERMLHRAGRAEFYEASFQQMLDGGVVINALDARGRACIEVDTPDDLAEARELAKRLFANTNGVGHAVLLSHPVAHAPTTPA